MDILNKVKNSIKDSVKLGLSTLNEFQIIIIVLIVIFYINYVIKNANALRLESMPLESFTDFNEITEPKYIYDPFYASIYDQLFKSDLKNEFEWYNIKAYTIENNMNAKDVNILDIGCGTGQHLKIFHREGFKATGLEQSQAMIKEAKINTNGNCSLIHNTALKESSVKPESFTHITMFFFTVYYFKQEEIPLLFRNINTWLLPEGFFCLHLVNPEKFDPVLERATSLIPLYNPQKHSNKKKTDTKLYFNKFNYIADWNIDDENSDFIETFVFNDGQTVRKNKHLLHIMPIEFYVNEAVNQGMSLFKVIDLAPARHLFNYIYIFKKQ